MNNKLFNALLVMIVITILLLAITCVVTICVITYEKSSNHSAETITEKTLTAKVETVNNYYEITEEERYLLAELAHSEASICSEECQRDVISVVFNRLESGMWCKDMNGDNRITVYDIIYYPNAFTPATNGTIDRHEPTDKDYRAVDYVVKNGPTVPTQVRYFRTDYDFNWDGYENYKVIDNMYFGYFVDWQKGAW